MGHEGRHASHEPQRSGCGASGSSARSTSTVPSTTQLPCSGVMRQPFFPTQPIPARSAQAFSITGATSLVASVRAPGSAASSSAASTRRRRFMTAW